MSDQQKPRSGKDRRKRDVGPPQGWKERRRNPERRLPEVEEISLAEFHLLMAGNTTPAPNQNAEEKDAFVWDGIRKL